MLTPQELAALIEPKLEAVLTIWCLDANGVIQSYGSGTKMDTGELLTAFHVVENCPGGALYAYDDPTSPVGWNVGTIPLVQPVAGRDLAIIGPVTWTTTGNAITGLVPVWDWQSVLGELTMTVGYPALFVEPQLSPGYVTQTSIPSTLDLFNMEVEWVGAFVTDAASAGGGSGGPVFDAGGNWVGIHVGSSSDDGLELSIQLPLWQ